MSTDSSTIKQSPFMSSVFGRKKRINGTKSADDIKGVASTINNGQTQTSGFIDSDHDSTKEVTTTAAPLADLATIEQHQQVTPTNSAFMDKIRYHRSARSKFNRDVNEIRQNSVPTQSSTLPVRTKSDKQSRNQRNLLGAQKKAFSADAVFTADPTYLMEALETLAEEQPVVARSIPKHAPIDTSDFAQRSLDNCLFDASVYDNMLCDSLKVCQLLQNHLNECIVTVRAKSPEKRSLERVVEEDTGEDSLATSGSSSKMTIIESSTKNFDVKRGSTLTDGSTASSIEFDPIINDLRPNDNAIRKLKSIVQYQC
uniref:Uncharacterized protein n=2 Tax=Parascaris univalens TaxID=6257 RepID=A0A915BU98_PARUN